MKPRNILGFVLLFLALVIVASFTLWWVYDHTQELRIPAPSPPPPCPSGSPCFHVDVPIAMQFVSVLLVLLFGVVALAQGVHRAIRLDPIVRLIIAIELPPLGVFMILIWMKSINTPLVGSATENLVATVLVVWSLVSSIVIAILIVLRGIKDSSGVFLK